MRWMKGKNNKYLIVTETEEEYEFARFMYNHKVIREIFGIYKYFVITSLTKDLEEAKQLRKHFPNAISALWLNIREEQIPKMDI